MLLTAQAFEAEPPASRGLSHAALLRAYAQFTSRHARIILSRSPSARAEAETRLFSKAAELGSRLRALLGVSGTDEAMSVARALYRMIGVDFRGCGGKFTVVRCAFAGDYSPEVCRLVSSLDNGLFSGLSRGKGLSFTQRITEGAASCRGAVT